MKSPVEDRGPLYTLSQVAERTGIHRMLLESYLHSAAWRVPTVWIAGEERYPREAIAAFQEMHAEAQRASAPADDPRPAEGDGPGWGRRRLLSLTAQRRKASAPAADRGAGARNGTGHHGDAGTAAPPAAEAAAPPEPSGPPAPAAPDADALRTPPPAAPRASRPLFTLQQVHEHTGIPYPTLAFYAASESGRIPAAGERYASLYPWAALAAFCRIHQERDPSWAPPALPPAPPSVEQEEASRQLSARLERLERAQSELLRELRLLIEEDERFLPATVPADHASS